MDGLSGSLGAPHFCLAGGIEIEVDDNVRGIVERPLDALVPYPGLLPQISEPRERGIPGVEVGDGMFDVKRVHGDSLVWRNIV
jgi:hypothetical protein